MKKHRIPDEGILVDVGSIRIDNDAMARKVAVDKKKISDHEIAEFQDDYGDSSIWLITFPLIGGSIGLVFSHNISFALLGAMLGLYSIPIFIAICICFDSSSEKINKCNYKNLSSRLIKKMGDES